MVPAHRRGLLRPPTARSGRRCPEASSLVTAVPAGLEGLRRPPPVGYTCVTHPVPAGAGSLFFAGSVEPCCYWLREVGPAAFAGTLSGLGIGSPSGWVGWPGRRSGDPDGVGEGLVEQVAPRVVGMASGWVLPAASVARVVVGWPSPVPRRGSPR